MVLSASDPTPPLDGCGVNVTIPGAHIQGYPTSGPNARAVPLPEHLTVVRRLEAERDAARAEADRWRRALDAMVTATHLAPDGKTRHGGVKRVCREAVCENDAADDAVQLTPEERREAGVEWRPKPVPMRGGEVA